MSLLKFTPQYSGDDLSFEFRINDDGDFEWIEWRQSGKQVWNKLEELDPDGYGAPLEAMVSILNKAGAA